MKNTMIQRAFLCLLTLSLTLCLLTGALGEARLPSDRGIITDDANVLSDALTDDITDYADKLWDEANVSLHVVTVHFLDGLDAQTYADRLFTSWKLGENDLLLLGAAGEDAAATAMGETPQAKLGVSNARNLMYTSSRFSDLFAAQKYDEAFGAYFTALNALVEKQYDVTISLNGLFQSVDAPQTAQASADTDGSQIWKEIWHDISEKTDEYVTYHETRQHENNGIGFGGWVVLGIIILLVFGQSDPARKARRAKRASLSPLGWLISLIGLNVVFDAFRRRHR